MDRIDNGPEQVMDAYRAELSRLYGEDFADKTEFYYGGGWYYLNVAKRTPDGGVGVWGLPTCYRKIQIVEMTENLRKRQPQA